MLAGLTAYVFTEDRPGYQDENHQNGYDRRAGVDDELPLLRITEEWTGEGRRQLRSQR